MRFRENIRIALSEILFLPCKPFEHDGRDTAQDVDTIPLRANLKPGTIMNSLVF